MGELGFGHHFEHHLPQDFNLWCLGVGAVVLKSSGGNQLGGFAFDSPANDQQAQLPAMLKLRAKPLNAFSALASAAAGGFQRN